MWQLSTFTNVIRNNSIMQVLTIHKCNMPIFARAFQQYHGETQIFTKRIYILLQLKTPTFDQNRAKTPRKSDVLNLYAYNTQIFTVYI